MGAEKIEKGPVIQVHEHPADVEDHVTDQAASARIAGCHCTETPGARCVLAVDLARNVIYSGNGITVPGSPGVAFTATTVALGKKLNSEALAQV